MPSQFFGLQIGYSGLTAYHAALQTTGNNIANVETEGYSRQRITQRASDALRTHTTYGMAGAGTTVESIDQIRNAYYDIKFRNTTASLGEYEVKAEYMKQIENYFNDDGETSIGFSTLYSKFFNALENVQNNPGDVSTRTAFIGQAQGLAEYFNALSEEMTTLQLDANTQIKDAVDHINAIAAEITTLNKQINIIEIKGIAANELRDQRNLLIDELSKYVDVTVTEDPIYSDKDNTVESGAHRYIVNISGTQTLVDGYDYRTLECEARGVGNKINQSDADGLYDIVWSDTKMAYYPVGVGYSGQLSGLLQIRDGNNNEYFHGKITEFTKAADPTGNATVSIKADAEYLQELDKLTLNGTGSIVLRNTSFRYDSFTVENHADGTSTYTFTLSNDEYQENKTSKVVVENMKDSNARVGSAVDYQGIPYYMEQMNEWVRSFAEVFNDIEQKGEDVYGTSLAAEQRAFFVAENITDSTADYNFTEAKDTVISSTSDSYYLLTAGNFKVNGSIVEDAGKMSTTSKQGDINLDDSDIVDELETIKNQKNFFRGCTASEFLNCVLGDIALNANSANNFESNFSNIQAAIANQRLSESGVDDDEEALDLVKYQNAYNLSAKMIQIMTEIYDRLILETGV